VLRAEIAALAGAGDWFEVDEGEGAPCPTHLSIAPGIHIAVTPIPGMMNCPAQGGRNALDSIVAAVGGYSA
jgi:hypothetical protein